MVGQLLEIRVELKTNLVQKLPWKLEKQQQNQNQTHTHQQTPKQQHHDQGKSQNKVRQGETQRAPLSPS